MKSPSHQMSEPKQFNDSFIGKVFLKKYLLVKKLGEGSFGMIYLGVYENERYALKFESRKQDDCLLETESYLLDYIKGPNIPYTKSYGSSSEYNILVMELLGKSLEDLMVSMPQKKFSLRTACNVGIQMVNVISFIHEKHFIHRDIKPDNFVVGLKEKMNQIYVIDFGLAKKYRSSSTLVHYPMKNKKKLTGTARYASINALKGFEQSRRDDLESIGYVLVYLLKGSLPWQGLVIRNKDDRYVKIMEKKESISPAELCNGLPSQFAEFIAYTRKLDYEQNPSYQYLVNLLKDSLKDQGWEYDQYCDWAVNNKPSLASNHLCLKDTKEEVNQSTNKNEVLNQYKGTVSSPQITVEKTYMNQINNILIINTNSSKEPNEGIKNYLEVAQNRILQQKSNQAMNSSKEKIKPTESYNEAKSDKEIIPQSIQDMKRKEEVNAQASEPIFQKSINVKGNPCSTCCFMYGLT